MVCQAASQTRFRAHKHENGIPGRTTIVVRVIACFQPLQNCQAEYFRQLLKPVTISKVTYCWTVCKYCSGCSFGWMVTAKESQARLRFSAWTSRGLSQMSPLQLEKNCSLPYFSPSTLTANLALPGQHNSHLHGFITGQPNAVAGNISYPSGNACMKNSQHGLGVSDKPIDASCAQGKRFLIFDRSGDHTRLFVSPSFSRQNNIISSKVPATASGLCEKIASGVDHEFLVRPVVEEKWDENSLNDEEGELVEDTEDINALLYSDSDDEYDGDDDSTNDGENYEVTSTRHTLLGIEDCSNKDKLLEQAMEEVASSDSSPKRRKLLDGSCKKSSLVSVEHPVKRAPPGNHKDDVEPHDIDSIKNDSRVKIHEAARILGSIIPGSNSKDPLSIIEKAIVYLETMKMEAKAVGYATSLPLTS